MKQTKISGNNKEIKSKIKNQKLHILKVSKYGKCNCRGFYNLVLQQSIKKHDIKIITTLKIEVLRHHFEVGGTYSLTLHEECLHTWNIILLFHKRPILSFP